MMIIWIIMKCHECSVELKKIYYRLSMIIQCLIKTSPMIVFIETFSVIQE
jgi:hypothetical protein